MNQIRFNKYLGQYAFVQTSSFLMIVGINLSFFFFAHLLFRTASKKIGSLIRPRSWLTSMILLFMLGAMLSTASNYWEGHETAVRNSLKVLPNYLYWSILLLTFIFFAERYVIDYRRLFRAVSIAIVVALCYYLFLQDYIANKWFFKRFLANNFSLLLICYTPFLVYYVRRHLHGGLAIAVLALLLLVQLVEGRRAGFGLVLAGGFLAYFVSLLNFGSVGRILRPAAIGLIAIALLYTGPVEQMVERNSPRIHQFIYVPSSDYLSEDRSYLTRLAMIEKGMTLFRDNVAFGIGLNNFTKIEARISGDFEGSEYVLHKDIYRKVSSHNSYVNILAEGGLFLAVPFAAILLLLLFGALRSFPRLEDPEKVILVSFGAMCIHLFFTNGIVNSLVWFNLALMAYIVSRPRGMARQRLSITPNSRLNP